MSDKHDAGDAGDQVQDPVDDQDAENEGLLDAFENELEAGERDSAEFGRQAKRAKAGEGDDEDDDGEGGEGDEDPEGDKTDEDEDDADKAEKDKAQAKGAKLDGKAGGDDPEGDYVEYEGNRFAVRDLLEAHQFKTKFDGDLSEIRQRAQTHYKAQVDEALKVQAGKVQEAEQTLELLKTLMPKLDPPSTSMLDKNHKDYDPDSYHFLVRAHGELKEAIDTAEAKVKSARDEVQKEHGKRLADHIAAQGRELVKRHPEFADAAKAKAKTAEMKAFMTKAYGFSEAEMNTISDARMFSVILDNMAFHAAKEKGAPKPKEAGAKPRLVRAGARQDPARGKASVNGAGKKAALSRLEKTGRVRGDDLEAVFGDFID